MSKIRVIPCLDFYEGRVIKGINFVDFKDAGDPVEIAEAYSKAGADELVFLDISATNDERDTRSDMVRKIAEKITIPFALGGGIKSVSDIEIILKAGADKVGINSAAVKNPDLIREAAVKFGSQRIVAAIDAKQNGNSENWTVCINGGKKDTGMDAISWAAEVQKLGAGEILLTSVDKDGTKEGYDIGLTKAIAERVSIPVIASGGAGKKEHFYEVITEGQADAVLAASLFHFKELEIMDLKNYLLKCGLDLYR